MKIIHIADIHWRGLSRHEEYILAFKDFFKKTKNLCPDIIYVGGDIVHNKTQGISPELIQYLSWWFNSLASICEVHVILGNHDGLILNKDRQDAITPIIKAINNPNIKLFKNSGIYPTGFDGINWCIFSCFDEEGWKNVHPVKGDINIALYHGAARGALTDTDWQLDGEISSGMFKGYDYALLGDIHKCQFLNDKKTIAYSGSTIQQNYGEGIKKGFLFWDIRGKNDFDVSFHEIKNVHQFHTIEWQGIQATIDTCLQHPRQSRFRIRADNFISQSDSRKLRKILKKTHNAKEVVYKIDSHFCSNDNVVDDNNTSLNLRNVDIHKTLLRNYYASQNLESKEWEKLESFIECYLDKISNVERESRNSKWTIEKIKFDNAFSYGDNNVINFNSLPGITGIFGKNAKGKSSIVGTIVYALFNTSDRGSIKNIHIINTRRNYCKAAIDIKLDGIPHRIVRQTRKKQTRKNIWAPTTLKFYKLNMSGEIIEDLTDEQRRETEKIIRSKIGNAEEFLMTSLASQGQMNMFIREKAAARKTILSNFLDLNIFDKLNEYAKRDSNTIRGKANSLSGENWQKKIDTCQTKIDDYVKQKVNIGFELEDEKKKLEVLNIELHKKDKPDFISKEELDNISEQVIKAQNEIDSLDSNIRAEKEKILESEEKIYKISSFLESTDVNELRNKRKAKIEIEKNLAEFKGILKLEMKELQNIQKSVRKLAEVPCGDMFPSCMFIKDSHKNKKRIDRQTKKVTYLSVKIDDISSNFKEYQHTNYEDLIEKYNKLLNRKAELISSISEEKVKIERYEQHQKQNVRLSKELSDDYCVLKEKFKVQKDDNELSSIKIKIYNIKKLIQKKDYARNRIVDNLATWKANKRLWKKQKDDYDNANKQLKLYDMFIQSTSKKGIPVQIIHSLLPKINSEIAKILHGAVDFTVELEADLETNSMDIYINYGDSRRIIELGSGMEKMMASLAIRVALINVSTLPKTNILIIDEGFGALDETNLESCGKLLQSLKKWFRHIIIISHIDAIKDIVDNTIDIMKKGVDSYVCQP